MGSPSLLQRLNDARFVERPLVKAWRPVLLPGQIQREAGTGGPEELKLRDIKQSPERASCQPTHAIEANPFPARGNGPLSLVANDDDDDDTTTTTTGYQLDVRCFHRTLGRHPPARTTVGDF